MNDNDSSKSVHHSISTLRKNCSFFSIFHLQRLDFQAGVLQLVYGMFSCRGGLEQLKATSNGRKPEVYFTKAELLRTANSRGQLKRANIVLYIRFTPIDASTTRDVFCAKALDNFVQEGQAG